MSLGIKARSPNAVLTKTKIVIIDPDADTVAICGLLHVATVETQQTA